MNRRRLFVALLWPSALVVLVGVLAFFQYRWLGQVSEADRDRQRSTLNQRAREFAGDFDREIGRAFTAMQFDPSAPDANDVFAKKYDAWKDATPFPQLIKAIYLTSENPQSATSSVDDTPVTLKQFNLAARTFSAVEWPASLAPVRERLVTLQHQFTAPASPFSSAGNTTFRFVSVGQSPIMIAVPALLIPTQSVQRYVIAELDKHVLTDAVLPSLVEKHLAVDDYHVEVLEPHPGVAPTPIFRKGLAANANLNPETSDASTTFFNVRMENVTVSSLRSVAGSLTIERQRVEATLPNRVAVMGRATPAVVGRGSASVGSSFTYGPGVWQLVLQHPAGSLEAAVTKARRRNLAISFGVLAVLSISVFMISINAQRSQQLAVQQMDFVATVSHELRTPIAVIRSAAQNLSAGVIHDAARAKKYGELIDTEGRRLTDMVEEVLEFAGISGGKRQFSIAPTDIGRLTSDVMESCESLIREAGFTVEVAVAPNLPMVNLDESAYRRALSNLVTNALKYAADGKWLAVTVFQAPDTQVVVVAVADRGRGIDPRDVPRIFDAFYRGSYAKDRQIHGNGLGLSLVQRIVDAHGGSVSVETSAAGSTFTMKFNR